MLMSLMVVLPHSHSRITNDEREEQMEKNMETVSTVLTNLKNMAIDMETELGVHSEQIKLINNMVSRTDTRPALELKRDHDSLLLINWKSLTLSVI